MIEIPDSIENYRKKRSVYKELSERVKGILFELLNMEKINYVVLQSRAKKLDSFQNRIKDPKNKKKKLFDLAGIRVVGYVRHDIEKIIEIIKENFDVDEKKSKDKSEELAPDRFGYRATHLICKLPDQRIILPEFRKFNDMFFEIQIKTILEHAWAEIEHDRNYKYKGLPKKIQREFYLLSGALESADNQFDGISKKIEEYEKNIDKKTKEGKLLEIIIDPLTLKRFLIDKFSHHMNLEQTYGFKHTGEPEILELAHFGIKNIAQLDKITHPKLVEIISRAEESRSENLTSMVYFILLCNFQEKYFSVVKKNRNETASPFKKMLTRFKKAIADVS